MHTKQRFGRGALFLLILVGLAVVAWWGFGSYVRGRLQRAEARVAEVRAELDVPLPPRPALFGTTKPGNAFDAYERAWRHYRVLVPDTEEVTGVLKSRLTEFGLDPLPVGHASWRDEELPALLGHCAPLLAAIREGAARGQRRWYRASGSGDRRHRVHAYSSAALLGWQVRSDWSAGRQEQALVWFLVALQYATDLMESGDPLLVLLGAATVEAVSRWHFGWEGSDEETALRPILDLAALGPKLRARARQALAQLDRLENPLDVWQRTIIPLLADPEVIQSVESTWRQGFSEDLMFANAVLRLDLHARRLAEVTGDWPTRKQALNALVETRFWERNRLVRWGVEDWANIEAKRRKAAVLVRSLRVVLDAAAGETRGHADPFGAAGQLLQVKKEGGAVVIESVGDALVDGGLRLRRK